MTLDSSEVQVLRRARHDLVTIKSALESSLGFLIRGGEEQRTEAMKLAQVGLDRLQAVVVRLEQAVKGGDKH